MKKILLLCSLNILWSISVFATVRTASVSGNWNSTTTWGGTVPVANDDVIINTGVTVTINTNPANIVNATINGTLQWDATGAGRTWTVTGNFTVNSGGVFNCAAPGSATVHTFNYNGTNLTNNGTFNLVNGTNKCNTVIGGSVTQSIGGINLLTLNKLTINNTGGIFQIVYSGGNFTPSEFNPTRLNVSVTTNDSCVVKRGLLIGCAASNAIITHTFANFQVGSSSSSISSSVSISGDATLSVNTGMILNDASNSNVTMTVNGSFTSPSMAQANAATAFGVVGPNCVGGANNATTMNINGDWSMTDIFVFVGNTKIFGGTEPDNPAITCSGNMSWASSETHTINLPFTSDDFYIKTCFFGIFDSQGAFPEMILDGGTAGSPKTFNIAFDVFDAEVQVSSPLGQETIAQISESMANWIVNGNRKILSGASLAIHSDNILTINGSLRVISGAEIAGSETETEDAGYIPVNGPSIAFGINGVLYVESLSGLGKGLLSEASSNVAIKNRKSDIDWNLGGISSSGTVAYEINSQPVTERTYNHLTLSAGTKTLLGAVTINGTLTNGISTTIANAGFNVTTKGSVVNNGTHSGTGKIIFNGITNQSLSGTGSDWGNLQMNNSAGATCSAPLTTSGLVTFTTGILSTSASAKLILTTSATVSTGTTTAYIDGPAQKSTASTSTALLPLGEDGNYRPLSITPSSGAPATWVAEYFATGYSNTNSVLIPLTSVNTASYWTCDRTSGTANANITLVWNTTEGLTDLNGLTVGRWNGTQWTDAGANTIVGTASGGSIKSNTVSEFSPFTLAEANTITTATISGSPFCPEAVVNVGFTSTGTFNAGNIYTAQLSDKKGNFTTPTAIGTLSSTGNSGNIVATIPSKPKSGTKYRIRVTSSGPIVTGSDNGTNMEVFSCDKVIGFVVSGVTSSGATVNWTGVSCVAKYKIQYRKQGTSGWTSKFTTVPSYSITGLVASTTYEYRVQTWCSESGSSKSGFTSILSFTTSPKLAGVQIGTSDKIELVPNPAADKVLISINSNYDSKAELIVYNALGQIVAKAELNLTEGSNGHELNITRMASGLYYVEVSGIEKFIAKLVKE